MFHSWPSLVALLPLALKGDHGTIALLGQRSSLDT